MFLIKTQQTFLNKFLIIFLIIGMLLAGAITVIYNLESKDYLERIMSDEKHNLTLQQKMISNHFKLIFADLIFLSKQFVSPLDLNVERGKIEIPLKPMIRFGTPVFDSNGNNRGVIVLNFLASNLIETIKGVSDTSIGSIMLINREGFWLTGPNPQDEWGFMYKDKADKKFGNLYPEVWRTISGVDDNQLLTDHGIFTSTTIYPFAVTAKSSTGSGEVFGKSKGKIDGRSYYWKLVSFVSENTLESATHGLLLKLFGMGALLFLLGSIPSYLIAKAIVKGRLHKLELIQMANYDKLTELPNRALFMHTMESHLTYKNA